MNTLFTTRVGTMTRTKADEYWLVTRGGKGIPGTVRVKDVAPSPDLFHQYLNSWRGRPPELWWDEYARRFVAEMEDPRSLQMLRDLYRRLRSGRSVALVCYCTDAQHCHRRLLGDFMRGHGVSVIEYCQAAQLHLL